MRRLPALLLAAALGLPAFAAQDPQAPPPPPPQARPHRGRGDLKALGLTEEQKQKLKEIRQQYAHDPEGRRKALMEALTPEQREKLKEIRRHRREQQRAPQGG
jgi:Spy/CpxP family protein refolding chaperone